MRVTVNGKTMEVAENTSLWGFILLCKIKPETVIIELNERVIRRNIWTETVLMEGDRIELVTFVGGG
ncbi:MAG: sulfur carrier protein ThiS [Proteobacteria bacterium]|nr:sulfur carrier protein ThiS [Pseudomonadota bacterium]